MLPISSTRVEVKSTCAVALVLFGSTSLRKHGVGDAVGLADGVGVTVGVGVGVGVTVGVGVGVAGVGVGVGVAGGGVGVGVTGVAVGLGQAPAIRVTSSMTKLPVPVVGPIYSKSRSEEHTSELQSRFGIS